MHANGSESGRAQPLGIAPPIRLPAPGRGRVRRWFSALVHRADLDSQLAAGVDPRCSPELVDRAAQLTSERVRRRLARGIERALADAARPPRLTLTAAVPVNRREIGSAMLLLASAAHRLSSPEPVSAEGVVLISRLLTDSAGPLYNFSGKDQLAHEAALALRALYPRDR